MSISGMIPTTAATVVTTKPNATTTTSATLTTTTTTTATSNTSTSSSMTPRTTPVIHQRAPRTPESYFNVPESIALLNIVKSERIQCAFQSNRKNHASVWEMVANILNRYSNRKRSAKQCCNRYENLKKIYTQLKRNPEKHVRRNWPYMYLFREIEEQRGETWGSQNKRNNNHHPHPHHHHQQQQQQHHHLAAVVQATGTAPSNNHLLQQSNNSSTPTLTLANNLNLLTNNIDLTIDTLNNNNNNNNNGDEISIKAQIKNELSYYQRRRNAAALTNMLLNRDVMLTNIHQHQQHTESMDNQNLSHDYSNQDRLLVNNFVETEINDCEDDDDIVTDLNHDHDDDGDPVHSIDDDDDDEDDEEIEENVNDDGLQQQQQQQNSLLTRTGTLGNSNNLINNGIGNIDLSSFGLEDDHTTPPELNKRRRHHHRRQRHFHHHHHHRNNAQEFGLPDFLNNLKDEPNSEPDSLDHDSNIINRRNSFINNNYNGHPEIYLNGDGSHTTNILHPAVIVDTDPNLSTILGHRGNKRKLSSLDHPHSQNLHSNNHDSQHHNGGQQIHPNDNINGRRRTTGNDDDDDRDDDEDDDDDDDGGESSTNYELIEYLRRREKRDENIQRRMDEREERLMKLLERTVVAIERIASQSHNCTHHNHQTHNNNNFNTNNANTCISEPCTTTNTNTVTTTAPPKSPCLELTTTTTTTNPTTTTTNIEIK